MLQSLLTKIEPILASYYRKLKNAQLPNLVGDREIEYSFICANIPSIENGIALDFGAGNGFLSLVAVQRGYTVKAIDLLHPNLIFLIKNLKYETNDIFLTRLPTNHYDLIINCSSIEHVGLSGRYGVQKENTKGDILAMEILCSSLKNNGVMLLTIPVGKDSIFRPYHRVYGKRGISKLLKKFSIVKEEYWAKDKNNKWVKVNKKRALSAKPSAYYYNLGCLVLKKVE